MFDPRGWISIATCECFEGRIAGAVTQRLGRFEVANRGTPFLDEIGDMPLVLQAKLMRVLQEQEFERLGSTITRRANVRIIAATNQDFVHLTWPFRIMCTTS
jgi:formate hydrogenlyase transcriptional activator